MADNYLSRVGKAVARGVPQMATGFVDLAGLPFTATGLLEPEQVFGSTAYLTDKGLLPQPQTGLLNETVELGSSMLNPSSAVNAGLIGLGGMVKLGNKSFPQFTEEALAKFKKDRIIPEAERIGNAPMPDTLKPYFEAYKQGDITYGQYNDKVMEFFPPNKFDKVPELTPVDDIGMALKPTQTKEGRGILGAGASIDSGTKVKSRLDINAYNNYGIWSTSIKGATKEGRDATVYGQTAHLVSKGDDKVKFTGSGDRALAVAEGGAKSPFATMDGYFKNTKPEDARKLAEKYMNDPNWVQVGMNPRRAGYFYDKADGMPVGSADEVIQIGALVLAKNAKKFDPSESLTKRVNPKTGGLLSF